MSKKNSTCLMCGCQMFKDYRQRYCSRKCLYAHRKQKTAGQRKFIIHDDYVELELTENKFTLLDIEDFNWVKEKAWCATGGTETYYYAARREWIPTLNRYESVKLHRLILGIEGADILGEHINGNTLDNRRCNLRIATSEQNQQNRRKRSDNQSGFKGVWASGSKWVSEIKANKERHYLGTFSTAELASKAYDEAAKKYQGEYAKK